MKKIRYLTADALQEHPKLRDTMFRDRANQFVTRLKWGALQVDGNGWEQDEYDGINPLYIVVERENGTHGASMRLLPMDGPNMIHDHFGKIVDDDFCRAPDIWECSRFLQADNTGQEVVSALFVGAGQLFRNKYMTSMLGVFNRQMFRYYKIVKNPPKLLESSTIDGEWLGIGAWKMCDEVWRKSLKISGISSTQSDAWFEEYKNLIAGSNGRFAQSAA